MNLRTTLVVYSYERSAQRLKRFLLQHNFRDATVCDNITDYTYTIIWPGLHEFMNCISSVAINGYKQTSEANAKVIINRLIKLQKEN